MAFGIAAEKMKTTSATIEGIADIDALKVWLSNNCPELNDLKISIAVNKKIVHDNVPFQNGDEVALLPAFSGG